MGQWAEGSRTLSGRFWRRQRAWVLAGAVEKAVAVMVAKRAIEVLWGLRPRIKRARLASCVLLSREVGWAWERYQSSMRRRRGIGMEAAGEGGTVVVGG